MTPLKVAIFDEVRKTHDPGKIYTNDQLNTLLFYHQDAVRLTFHGYLILKKIFTVYSFELTTPLMARHQIGMSVMEFPYYISSKRLILFSEMDSMMIKLQGSVEIFLENCFNIDRVV